MGGKTLASLVRLALWSPSICGLGAEKRIRAPLHDLRQIEIGRNLPYLPQNAGMLSYIFLLCILYSSAVTIYRIANRDFFEKSQSRFCTPVLAISPCDRAVRCALLVSDYDDDCGGDYDNDYDDDSGNNGGDHDED